MPDHVHLLIEGENSDADMQKFVALFKQKTAYWFKGIYGLKLWEVNYYEHVLRNDEATNAVARYIIQNPVRRGMVEDCSSYPYSGSFEVENIYDL
jgi:REP element-mobilizing transposase RayT